MWSQIYCLNVSQHFIAIFINALDYLQQSGHWQQLWSHSDDKHSQGSVEQYLNLGRLHHVRVIWFIVFCRWIKSLVKWKSDITMRINKTSSSHIRASVHKKKASILQVPQWQSHQTKVWSLKSHPEDPNVKSKNWNSHKQHFKHFFTAFSSYIQKPLLSWEQLPIGGEATRFPPIGREARKCMTLAGRLSLRKLTAGLCFRKIETAAVMPERQET